jgi:hypothetical protein
VSELETTIRDSAEPGEWTADWDDVLRRSGHSRYRSRRAAAIAAVAAVAVVLALPGIGIGGGLNAWVSSSRRPGLQLRAALMLSRGGRVGTLSLGTSRIFFATPRQAVLVHKGLKPVPIRWSLELVKGTTADSAVLEDRLGKATAHLCAPCAGGAHGTINLRPRAVLTMLGQSAVVVKTSAGTARGVLRLPVPVR